MAEWVSLELEFRGINREHLCMYFEELGGKRLTVDLPIIYVGDTWRGEVLREEEIHFTSVFKVNAVFIRFSAMDDEELELLIKNYRYKTTRVGG